jgi:diguanylate cyclase (GGDEF)-like protein
LYRFPDKQIRRTRFGPSKSGAGNARTQPAQRRARASQQGNLAVTTLAVLVPTTALLLALLPAVEGLLASVPRDDLPELARSISERTVQRLTAADHLLRVVSSDVAQSETLNTISTSTRLDAFTNVTLFQQEGPPIVLKGSAPSFGELDASTIGHLNNGRTALITNHNGTYAKPALLRTVRLASAQAENLLFAEVSADYLWHAGQAPDRRYRFCVTDAANKPVFCEQTASSPQQTEHGHAIAALDANESPLDTRMTESTRVGLDQRFAGGHWTVSVSQQTTPSFLASRPLIRYAVIGVAGVLLSFVIACWIRNRRTHATGARQQLKPATQSQGTSGMEKPTHASASKVSENTQAPDINTIALHLFSEIDRAILSGATFDRIVESILDQIPEILPGDVAGLALLDRDKPALCKLTLVGGDAKRQDYPIEEALDARATAMLTAVPDGQWFDTAPDDGLLETLHSLGLGRSFIIPIFRDGSPAGALMIATRTSLILGKREHELARDIAHRLGVAYTATTRGQELLFHSLYDSTTELPNRKFFENRLEEEISRARRESNPLALLLVDLDKFKEVNDSFGHEAGDVLLEQSSARLKTCLRAEDLVARIGSDEFAILLPSVAQGRDVGNVAQKLIDTLSESYMIQGRDHHLTASIGIAVFPKDGRNGRALLGSADFAMNDAKRNGGATFCSYEPHSNEQAQDRTALTNDLRQAVSKQELVLYYQPQIDLARGEIVGVEALLRWNHPTRGLVMPTEFISIAEQSDLIERIGDFVRQEAGKQFRIWESAGCAPMRVSINVSSRELRSPEFLGKIETMLLSSGLRPFSLELEITESLLLEHSDHVVSVLKALNNRGVRIAIDDFGTGYSSMAYLKKIPFHVLKIDRLFVKDIGTADGSDSIVHAIIGVAQGLGKEVVSEGIETEQQRAFLAENGCDVAQGFLWSEPVRAEEFATFMQNWNDSAKAAKAVT